MRNFEERKKEVFRRSEQRIENRKRRRKQITVICLPLLCVTLLAAAFQPFTAFNTADDALMSNIESGVQTSPVIPDIKNDTVGQVELTKDGVSTFYTAPETVSTVSSIIADIVASNAGNTTNELYTENSTTSDSAVSETAYTITITDAQGNTHIYMLSANILTDVADGFVYWIGTEDLSVLKNALDISDKGKGSLP